MTNTLTADAAATIAPDPRSSRRPAPTSCASPARTRNRPRRCTAIVKAVEGADRRRHPFPLQARHRGGQGGRRLPAHQSRQYRLGRARARSGARRPRITAAPCASASMPARWSSDLLEKYGEPCPEAMVESALDHARILRGPRLPRVQDQREGVRRLPGRRRLSAAGRGHRLPAASRHHRGGRHALRHGQIVDRHGHRCCGPASATPSASRSPPIRWRRSGSASTS